VTAAETGRALGARPPLLMAEQLIRLFTDEPAVVATGAEALRIWALGSPLYAWAMVPLRRGRPRW